MRQNPILRQVFHRQCTVQRLACDTQSCKWRCCTSYSWYGRSAPNWALLFCEVCTRCLTPFNHIVRTTSDVSMHWLRGQSSPWKMLALPQTKLNLCV